MGNFQVYVNLFPKLERKDYAYLNSNHEFFETKEFLNFLYQTDQRLFFNRKMLLVEQMKWNAKNQSQLLVSNETLRKEIKKNVKIISSYPLKKEHKTLLTQAQDCIKKVHQKDPSVNLGFYSGFFSKYALSYEPNESKMKTDEVYQKISNKLKINYFQYTVQSELFEQRLRFVQENCTEMFYAILK